MFYFAYGSNLHPLRFQKRIGEAVSISIGEMRNARLRFNKIGRDGSGKCNIVKTYDVEGKVFGAIYDVSNEQEQSLDRFEFLGDGYDKISIDVYVPDGGIRTCFKYVAMPDFIDDQLKPFDWYKELVYLGAQYHVFPREYIQDMVDQPTIPDDDRCRAKENRALITEIRKLTRR